MTFGEAISSRLLASGIVVGVDEIPEREAYASDLDSLATWLAELDSDTRDATEKITGENQVKSAFADLEVAIVTRIGPILEAFDNAEAGFSISAALDLLRSALDENPE